MINPETVDRIKQAADIVEVVGDYVSLKKRGSNYTACCPFHNEKTPSFNVNPSRQIFKCFGCGAAGDAIKFVMDIDGIGYGEALKHLAQKYSIEVQEEKLTDEQEQRQNERESLYIVLNFAKNYFQKQLTETEEGQSIALSYLKERGFNETIRQKFELGYSPEAWDALTQEALSKGHNADLLEKAGLMIRREDSKTGGYDRFRGRVIFPIHNVAGKVIAFGARILKNDPNAKGHQPKYVNSPETDVYHKSDVLYGIYQAKKSIRQLDVCYLVEGYTDVVSLHQAGVENVVASSGTSLTVEQIRLIGRFTPNVTILYDGDPAGIKAALRGLDLVLEEGLNVSVVTFPNGEDPDSYVQRVGAEEFKKYIQSSAQDFITFKTQTLLADAGNDPFRRAAVITDVVSSIVKIPDPIQRQIFFPRIADLMHVDEQTLISEGNKILRKEQAAKARTQDRRAQTSLPDGPGDFGVGAGEEVSDSPNADLIEVDVSRSKLSYQEEAFVRLLVLFGRNELEPNHSVCEYVLHQIQGIDFADPVYGHILELFRKKFEDKIVLDTDFFLNHPESRIREITIGWLSQKYELSDQWTDKYKIEVPREHEVLDKSSFTFILRLKKVFLEEKFSHCSEKLKSAKSVEEETALQMETMEYRKRINLAANELGIVVG